MQDNPCIKTGGWCHLAEADEYVYGDIYEPAEGCIQVRLMNGIPSNIQYTKPEGVEVWATIENQRTHFTDGAMSTISGVGKAHFEWRLIGDEMVQVAL